MQDAQQGLALLWRRTPVDNVPAFAFEDGAGPTEDAGGAETVEPRRAVKALLDVEYREPAAMPVRRQRVELVGAAIVAIAAAEFPSLDLPRDHLSTSLIEPPELRSSKKQARLWRGRVFSSRNQPISAAFPWSELFSRSRVEMASRQGAGVVDFDSLMGRLDVREI
jgi:hypothetical protein